MLISFDFLFAVYKEFWNIIPENLRKIVAGI